jgi:hypothetical protein
MGQEAVVVVVVVAGSLSAAVGTKLVLETSLSLLTGMEVEGPNWAVPLVVLTGNLKSCHFPIHFH